MADNKLYDALLSTATSFLACMRSQTSGSNDMDPDTLREFMHHDSQSGFGHKYFTAPSPYLSAFKGRDEFIENLRGMSSGFKTWTLDIVDTNVDVRRKTVIARVELNMSPNHGEPVLNDVVFWLTMDKSGEKVVKSIEFLDAAATNELMSRRSSSVQD